VKVVVATRIETGHTFVGRISNSDYDRGWENSSYLSEAAVQGYLSDVEKEISINREHNRKSGFLTMITWWQRDLDRVATETFGDDVKSIVPLSSCWFGFELYGHSVSPYMQPA
jgi:hypothetical protein